MSLLTKKRDYVWRQTQTRSAFLQFEHPPFAICHPLCQQILIIFKDKASYMCVYSLIKPNRRHGRLISPPLLKYYFIKSQINTLRLITIRVWSNKVKFQVLYYFIMSNVSRKLFCIYSAPHTQIFLNFVYVVIGPSISTNNRVSFLLQFFQPLPLYHLVRLS